MTPDQIATTIKRHAFSGGKQTKEEHQRCGGNVAIDISYQYLTFFLESDDELKDIARKYSDGEMLSSELKKITADLITDVVYHHQLRKDKITDEDIKHFFDSNKTLEIGGCYDRPYLESQPQPEFAGLDFDRTFGCKSKLNSLKG